METVRDNPRYSPFRPVKCKSTGIGMQKDPQKPKRVNLKPVSTKQAHRNYELKKKLKAMIREQELEGEIAHCQICQAIKTDSNGLKLVADHVFTRNQADADRYGNLGVACWKCNSAKGSVRPKEDYRPKWFQTKMQQLDR